MLTYRYVDTYMKINFFRKKTYTQSQVERAKIAIHEDLNFLRKLFSDMYKKLVEKNKRIKVLEDENIFLKRDLKVANESLSRISDFVLRETVRDQK